jgi:DNA-binding NarL/FixJ family response regulator
MEDSPRCALARIPPPAIPVNIDSRADDSIRVASARVGLKMAVSRKVRVLLADDHPLLLKKVLNLLEPTFEVVGRVHDGKSLFESAMKPQADVIISDISMPILNGIEAANKLKVSGCRSKIVFLTVHSDPEFVRACLATGALGYVAKSRMVTDLRPAIREALADRIFISPLLNFRIANNPAL